MFSLIPIYPNYNSMKSKDQFDLQKFYLEYTLDGKSIDKARCKCYAKLD